MKYLPDHQATLHSHVRVPTWRSTPTALCCFVPLGSVGVVKPHRQRSTFHQRCVVRPPVPYPILLLLLAYTPGYGACPDLCNNAIQLHKIQDIDTKNTCHFISSRSLTSNLPICFQRCIQNLNIRLILNTRLLNLKYTLFIIRIRFFFRKITRFDGFIKILKRYFFSKKI